MRKKSLFESWRTVPSQRQDREEQHMGESKTALNAFWYAVRHTDSERRTNRDKRQRRAIARWFRE